jgi:uncharacterized membrane protein
MKHLKHWLKQPLQAVPNKFIIVLGIIALIGFGDASFLTIEHYHNLIPPCTTLGCEAVLSSAYSTILGIPVSLLGMLYYFAMSIGLFAYVEGKYERVLRTVLLLTVCGFLMSLWFIFLQAFVIHAYCLYCLGSATTSTILFIGAVVILRKYQSQGDTLR